jgi:hypothetical protein
MENSKRRSSLLTKMMLSTTALLAIQATPFSTLAQETSPAAKTQNLEKSKSNVFLKIRNIESRLSIVGFENGTPVFKNTKGEFFTIDGKTGDQVFIKPEEFAKFYCCIKIKIDRSTSRVASASGKRIGHIKMESEIANVSVLGVDQVGNTIQKNSRGETFTLDPVTGDMIFINP